MKEWCEEAGEWIGEDDYNEYWWHTCLSKNCPYYISLNATQEKYKLYLAGNNMPNYYDYKYREKYFCPFFKQFIYPEEEKCFSER